MSNKNKSRDLFDIMESKGYNPVESFEDANKSFIDKTVDVASDIGSGFVAYPSDMGAKGLNTMLDIANAIDLEEAIHMALNDGDASTFQPYRFSGATDVAKGKREVSGLEEGTSDLAGLINGMVISGGTNIGKNILSWGAKGNIGRKVLAEATVALPVDVLMSDDSGEHLLFDDDTKESVINRRAKNIVENVGLGMVGDFALRGVSKAYKTWRGAGKTTDDATQAAFNTEVPEGQADEVNKVRPTAELLGNKELNDTYIQNPMYKIENRESLEAITAGTFRQMDNVSKAEFRVREATDIRFKEASDKEAVPFNPTQEGYSPEDIRVDEMSNLGGKQDREDMLNIFDAWASGKVSDEVSEKYTRRFLRSFMADEVDEDVLKILDEGLTGKERESVMRKVREKFMNNPFLVDEKNFQDKLKVQAILSKKLGFNFTKKRRSMLEVLESYKKLALKKDTDKQFAQSLSRLSRDTGMDQEALMRNMSNLGVTTARLPEYVRGLTDVMNTHLDAMAVSSKALIKELKEADGKLDLGSQAFKKWFTAFGATNEIYAGVAHVKGNIGLAMRTMQESSGSGIKSYIKQYDDLYVKGTRTQAQDDASSAYMRAKQVTQDHADAVKKGSKKRPDGSPESIIDLAQDPKAFTDELIKMIRMSSDVGRAKKLVSGSYKTEKQGIADMFISMGISNMLASPMTIGKIALSTANYVVYKQTLIPVFSGLANMVTRGDTGQRPIKDLVQRWVGMARVVQKYAQMDQKSMSRGFRGMQIEGQGFTDMKFKDLLKFVDEKANNPISKFGGRLMSAPLWFGNQVMSKGIIPVDDFFRRVMLEAETEGAIHNLYIKGVKGKPSTTSSMASSFNNFDEYRKTMLPLFTDVKNTLYSTREATEDEVRKKMAETFNKYTVTRLDDDAQAVIMAEVLRAERRAAEAVSQETTEDMVLGRVVKGSLNAIESLGPIGRVTASTLVPFQTAPLNLMRSAMEETPGLNLLSRRWWAKYKGSAKDKNEAIAQVLAGTTVGMGAWGLVNSLPVYGHIPIEEMRGAQEMGIQPYSIVIDGKAYSYDFLGTFKAPLAMFADFKRYGMEGNNVEAFQQSLKTFALAAGNNPYFDSMQELTNLFSDGASMNDLKKLMVSKSTQFLQVGSGLNRAVKAGMGGEVETSALSEYYDNVWLRELDMRNKDNPAYRFFRDFTNPKAYTQKTNLFGEGLTRNGGDMSSFLPYISMGISSTPAPTSPGLVLLKELDLVNQDFTEIGDVIVDGARAQEIKEKTFGDQGLGLARLLNSYATDDAFMSASDSYRKGVISKLVTDHVSQVQSNMGLDVIEKQYEIDELNRKLDFDSHGAKLDISASARRMGEYIYGMEKSKIDKGTIKTQGVDQILK